MTTTRTSSPFTAVFRRPVGLACRAVSWMLLLGMASQALAANVFINVGTVQELRAAVTQANADPGNRYFITVTMSLQLDEFAGSGAALPAISGDVLITEPVLAMDPVVLSGGGMGSDFRLVEVSAGGKLFLGVDLIRDFRSSASGGCIAVGPGGSLKVGGIRLIDCVSEGDGGAIFANNAMVELDSTFIRNGSAARGGAIAVLGDQPLVVRDLAILSGNMAMLGGAIYSEAPVEIDGGFFTENVTEQGGAISLRAAGNTITGSSFSANRSSVPGCDLDLIAPNGGIETLLRGNFFRGQACGSGRIDNRSGPIRLAHNTGLNTSNGRIVNSIARVNLLGNLLSDQAQQKADPSPAPKTLCADFGSGALVSLGDNVATDASCALTEPDDLVTGQPGLLPPDSDGITGLAANSPAVDRGLSGLSTLSLGQQDRPFLPCGYRDIRGLGRPQDGDGDGVFECDSGAWELQGGPDIGNAQSAAYFDVSRNGEGVVLEMIGSDLATVSVFTFGPDGGMAWFTGLGSVVGNSVVVDELQLTSGGRFGNGFDEDAVERTRVGGLSLVFPDCAANAQPGRQMFQTALGSGYEDLLVTAQRVTTVVPCSGTPGPDAGLSGGYFPPGRSGEGVFLQVQPDGSIVMVFYSYTPDGQLFWAIAGDASLNGNVVTASMLYPAGTTRFGSNFNANQIDLQPWGTITMTFTDCDNLTFAWNSQVPGYGSGSYPYTRVTSLAGTTCSLQ